ncbi:MAG: GNAT family N-acetyltransferase [Chitinivibrionales bacterium]|nr:GNAT family N-acetyltransferase [Chitinivibrionales bacterium]
MDEILYEESLDKGMRYTEKWSHQPGRRPRRLCELWLDGVEGHIAYLGLVSFNQRFGAIAVPSEGFAGVATPPQHRRKGYLGVLFRKAVARAAQRVDVAFLYGVQGLYAKYGFTGCYTDCRLRIAVRDAEHAPSVEGLTVRPMKPSDHAAMVTLFNEEHKVRPWSHERHAETYPGPRMVEDWDRGEIGLVAESDGRLLGYAVVPGPRLGVLPPPTVAEICCSSSEAAAVLVRRIARRANENRQETLTFLEPPDSTAGRFIRRLGCETSVRTNPDGDGMGLVLNRADLVRILTPELDRRAASPHPELADRLAAGTLIPDNKLLLRLLLGYYSWHDAGDLGALSGGRNTETLRAWFPGHCGSLAVGFTHSIDRY